MSNYDHPPEVLNSEKVFYVAKNGENLGVFRLSELLENIYSNIFFFDHLYFREGMTEWATLDTIYRELLVTPSQIKAEVQHRMMIEQTPWRLKQIIEKQKRTLGELKKAPADYKKIKNEIDDDIAKVKARVCKDIDEEYEKNWEIRHLEAQLDFLDSTHDARDPEFTKEEISDAKKGIKETEETRRLFWKSTFEETLKEPNKKETAQLLKTAQFRVGQIIRGWTPRMDMYCYFDFFHSKASRGLFAEFGDKIKCPTETQIRKTLEGLDDMDIDWENKDATLFHRTLETWFPELKKI